MSNGTVCELCLHNIPEERAFDPVIVCAECGHVSSSTQKEIESAENKKFTVSIVIGGFVLAALVVSLFKWQDHVWTAGVASLKAEIGMASNAELSELSNICRELLDADCVENAHRAIASSSGANIEDLHKYGNVLFMRAKHSEALAIYDEYFKRGGNSLDAEYDYARLLSHAGRDQEASSRFLHIIDAKPDIMQHTVAAAYVDHLIKMSDLKTARKFISTWRSKGTNASTFLESHWQKLQKLDNPKS